MTSEQMEEYRVSSTRAWLMIGMHVLIFGLCALLGIWGVLISIAIAIAAFLYCVYNPIPDWSRSTTDYDDEEMYERCDGWYTSWLWASVTFMILIGSALYMGGGFKSIF